MKKILLLFLFSSPLFAPAQHFLDTSKTWSVLMCVYGNGTYCSTIKYKLIIDTVVNGETIFELYETGDSLGLIWHPTSYFLSEDTLNKQVFFNGSGNVLYDFLLNKGDTTYPANPFGGSCGYPEVVDSVDTFVYSGIPRRRIFFNIIGGSYSSCWIDGIGGMEGIFHSFYENCVFDASAHLLCCDSAGVQIYQSPIYNSCYLVLNTIEPEKKSMISVSPNPFYDRIFVNTSSDIEKDLNLEIVDPSGRIVFKFTVRPTEKEILIPLIADGVYFISLQNDKFYSVIKMVKSN